MILLGDVRDRLRELAPCSVDSIVTDPPYELGFMGKAWDASGIAYDAGMWRDCLRVLKPGGHLLSFGGSRTYHRMACAIEDAGFEIRDQIMWIYGSGFPKSLDVSKAIDKAAGAVREVVGAHPKPAGNKPGGSSLNMSERGMPSSADITAPATEDAKQWEGWGTALKPAHEPVCVARKPLIGTVAQNVLAHGTGALNIDACRVETSDVLTGSGSPPLRYGGENSRPFHEGAEARGCRQNPGGRFPANVILDEEAGALLDAQTGELAGPWGGDGNGSQGGGGMFGIGGVNSQNAIRGIESGGASRFFYCAKASGEERGAYNSHPTVKPVDLMRHLVRLVTPPGGTVLDPFAGSGTTGVAAKLEGFAFVLIELCESHVAIIERRLADANPSLFEDAV